MMLNMKIKQSLLFMKPLTIISFTITEKCKIHMTEIYSVMFGYHPCARARLVSKVSSLVVF